jgi:FAE1/Type III polyketide synthase-like protein
MVVLGRQLGVASTGLRHVSDGRRQDRWSAKYELLHTVRTHMGASDANFGCVVQREDANGKVGRTAVHS